MAVAGKSGKAVINAATIASVNNWKADFSAKDLDSTQLGDDWESSIGGLLSGAGSLDCQYAVPTDTNGQMAIQTAFLARTPIALKLYTDAVHYYNGNALVTKMGVETPKDDVVKASFDFKTTGAWQYN